MKITAMMSGGDWCDASVDFIVLNDGIHIEEEKKKRDIWYKEVYSPSWDPKKEGTNKHKLKYLSLIDWLIENGKARKATGDEVEEFWE